MSYTAFRIQKAFKYRLIAAKSTKKIIVKTILLFPDEIIDFVTHNCWFVSSFEDGWAFVLKASELKENEYLIFLSDELIHAGEEQMRYTIIHEIGHVVLGHRNAIGVPQKKSEIKKQEKEADEFAREFLEKLI